MLQRDLYDFGIAGLIMRDEQIPLLWPDLGETRHQELRNFPFSPSPLFHSQLVKEEETFLHKKDLLRTLGALSFIKTSPFVAPHCNKEAPTGSTPMEGIPPKQQLIILLQGNSGNRTSKGCFRPNRRGRGCENPSSHNYHASNGPLIGARFSSFRRDWLKEKCSNNWLNIITDGHIFPFIKKPNLAKQPLISSGYKDQQKPLALASCIQSILIKNTIERVDKEKSLGFYSCLFLVPKPQQKWRPVKDQSRLNSFLKMENSKKETSESIRVSLIPGKWVASIDLSAPTFLSPSTQPQGTSYSSPIGVKCTSAPLFPLDWLQPP